MGYVKTVSNYLVFTEKVSFSADSRRYNTDGRRLYRRNSLRVSAFDPSTLLRVKGKRSRTSELRKSAFKKGFSVLTI